MQACCCNRGCNTTYGHLGLVNFLHELVAQRFIATSVPNRVHGFEFAAMTCTTYPMQDLNFRNWYNVG